MVEPFLPPEAPTLPFSADPATPSDHARARPTLAAASTHATIAAIAGYVPGFFIPIAIAWSFGATASTDAFFLALSAASLIANALGATSQQAAIPFLISARRENDDLGAFIGQVSTSLLLLALIPIVVLNSGVLAYVQHRAHWPIDGQRVLVQCLWAFLPYVVCSVLAGTYSGVLNAEHFYVQVALSPAIRSGIVLAAVLLLAGVGVYAIIIGYLAGELVRLLFLLKAVSRRHRVRLWAWPHASRFPEFSKTAVAQMLGSGVLAFLPLLDRTMASRLHAGSVSLVDYADRLWQVPLGFVLSGFLVTSLSHWSERLYGGGSVSTLSRDTRRSAALACAVLIPPIVLFMFIRVPAMNLLFRSSKFSAAEIGVLTNLLTVLVLATPVYVSGLVYTRAFLVLKRSDLLLAVAVVQLACKMILNTLLIGRIGLTGIVVSTALTYTLASVMVIVIFHSLLARRPLAGEYGA